MGGKIPGRIKKDLRKRIKRAKKIIFFLDYDGTLVPIRKKPGLARIHKSTKTLLKRISKKSWSRVFIISGRTLGDIRNLVGIKSISYSGNHGIELEGPGMRYINPTAKAIKPYIQKCHRALKRRLRIKGAILENKFYTLSVHYRLVRPGKIDELTHIFERTVGGFGRNKKIKVTRGKKVFEVRPNINWHKGKILRWILRRIKGKFALPIYIGDDITDEDAFRALGRKGVGVLVSRRRRRTAARYRLGSPGDVIKFLEFVERERVET